MKAGLAVPHSGTRQPLTSCQARQPVGPRNYCSPQSSFLVWSFLPCSLCDVGQLFPAGLGPGPLGHFWALLGLIQVHSGSRPQSFTQFILCLLSQVSLLPGRCRGHSFCSNTRTIWP